MTTRIFLPPRPLSQYRQSGDRRNFAKIIFIKKTKGRVVYSIGLPHFQYLRGKWRATKWDTNHRIPFTSTLAASYIFVFGTENTEVQFEKWRCIKHEENFIGNWIWYTLYTALLILSRVSILHYIKSTSKLEATRKKKKFLGIRVELEILVKLQNNVL